MKAELLQEIIERINSVKIAVVGDFCLDAYWFVDESKSEISIETCHATRPVRQQKYSLGGAGNVTNNLAAMEVKDIRALGVIGHDPFGPEMVNLMKKAGINTDNLLIQNEQWATHVYIKPYIDDKEQNRIDFGNYNKLSEETANRLIYNLEKEVNEVDLVIINQQVLSGIHTEYFKKKLVEVINRFPEKIFIADSRNYTDFYTGAYRKMNDTEASLLCGIKKEPDEIVQYSDTLNAAKTLYHRYQKPLFITRGSRGSLAVNESGVKLYLASGTDKEDVKNEAAVLGYDHLFEGGIFGAVGDVNKEAKKIVLDRILDMIGESETGQIATFGDGPVEIRKTHKRGGIIIGVASNELKRYGLNQVKRTRLIKAGADIIVPDFSQSAELLSLLNIK